MAIPLGKIRGIPIALDYSWFVIFFLLIWSIGFGVMPAEYPGLSTAEYVAMGVVASVLLFVSILIHELAHSVVAQRYGLKIRRITLFLFGGVSELMEQPQSPSVELRMSLAGPLTSVALAVVLFALWELSVFAGASVFVQAPLNYGSLVNGMVAGFNLIPAFPMDGGRALRSALWRRNGDLMRSTETSVSIARALSYGIAFFGVFLMLTVNLVTGLWLMIIGWFISTGAQGELSGMLVQEELGSLRAGDIMTWSVDSVPPGRSLAEMREDFINLKHNGFPVVSGDDLLGCVTRKDLKKVRKEEWQGKTVGDVMTRRADLKVMSEDEPAARATELMGDRSIRRVLVVGKDGRLAGIITRSDVMRTVRLQQASLRQGARRGAVSLTVEKGMDFILEQPTAEGGVWSAAFDRDGVRLLKERTSRHPDGREYSQFVFEAVAPGVVHVSLALVRAPHGASRTVRYRVNVMESSNLPKTEKSG